MPSTNSGEFCFHPKALAILEQCVRKLMDDGGNIGCAKLWSGAMFTTPSSGVESSLENTRTRVDEIQTLKSLSKDMSRLKESLDMFIENHCEELLSATRHHGSTSLPNEILLHNVLAFAEVWTYLDLKFCGNQALSLFLQRTRNRLLNVSFGCSAETVEIVRRALQFSDRWQSLYLDVEDSEHLSLLPSLSFPAVKTLIIHGHNERSYPWISPGWTFPCAEDVTLGGTIPDPGAVRYESLRTLTYFVPSYSKHRARDIDPDSDRLFLTRLTNFLQPAISLYALYLDVAFDYYRPNRLIEVELPNVKIFSISNWESHFVPDYSNDEYRGVWFTTHDYFSAIARAIKLPKVQDIRVELAFEGDSFDIKQWLHLAFPDLKSVTSLTFAIKRGVGVNAAAVISFGDLSRCLHSIQSLALDTRFYCGDVELLEGWGWGLENLRSLQMKLWNIVQGTEEIYGMLRKIVELGAPLRKVDIRSPYALDIEALEEIVPGAVVYTTTLNSRA
ncbi:hypothetical protein A7U60_g1543 [Sanghuangporus baumii]|uniref:Uncharacterized protein n=1 Tax=Sanghuangporus baumii TaxID=108892 RepID=A0A9Q5I3U1_SANBA|nr:hypothetical protein A7U60_g1543 [Sanghuangporus baumii]